jgi:4-hydroxy-tetrahydrodipicolinate synthase
MGGFAFMTDSEQLRAIDTVMDEVQGKLPVMAGLGETSTSRAVPRAREMARTGVQFLSVLPPFYFFASQEHLYAYFSEIASVVDVPIVLYDNPVLTKNPLPPETIAELHRRIPNIVGVKESNQDCVNLQRLLALTRHDQQFSVLTGSEFLILVGLQMGVHGCVGGLHNICPRIVTDLYEAFQRGDISTAQQRQTELIELWQIFNYGKIWGAFDEALRWLGICERATGAPYVTNLSDEERSKVHDILAKYLGEERSRTVGAR